MKSVPGTASFAEQTVAKIMVLPSVAITAPSACFANLPVSNVMTRPSGKAISFLTIFICLIVYERRLRSVNYS